MSKAIDDYRQALLSNPSYSPYWNAPVNVNQYVNDNLPRWKSPRFWKFAVITLVDEAPNDEWRYAATWTLYVSGPPRFTQVPVARMLHASLLYCIWPWLTCLSLMIYQASMRRAKVLRHHVLRAVIYTHDIGWIFVGIIVLVGPMIEEWVNRNVVVRGLDPRIGWLLIVATLTTWRLSIAYKYYLRFDRPLATVVASQVIAVLLAIVIWVNLRPVWW